jgi:hypothetical protein
VPAILKLILYRWPPAGAIEFDFCSVTIRGGKVFEFGFAA